MRKSKNATVIRSYGLHWKRDYIEWGSKGAGNAGKLVGKLINSAKAGEVNFRQQAGVYVLHDRFTPIYVGQVGRSDHRLFLRLRDHTRNHLADRWDRFSWFGIFPVKGNALDEAVSDTISSSKEDLLNHLEGILIAIAEPALNRKGANLGSAQQFRQVPKKELEEEEEESEVVD